MSNKKDFFQELIDRNSSNTSAPSTKLNNDDLNKLVDTIAPTVKPEPSPEESLFTSLERAQDKRGES